MNLEACPTVDVFLPPVLGADPAADIATAATDAWTACNDRHAALKRCYLERK